MAEHSSSSVTIQPANDLPRQISQHLSDKMKSRAVTRVTETLSPMRIRFSQHLSDKVKSRAVTRATETLSPMRIRFSQHRRTGVSLDAFP